MKKILLFFFFISTAFAGRGQNLVPNGDFEQYSGCPIGFGQIDSALFWLCPQSPCASNYFNHCSTPSIVDVPNNFWGFQQAHSGMGYSGIYIWYVSNYRQYIEVPLTVALLPNMCYFFEMYVSMSNICRFTTDDIGVYFSDTSLTGYSLWDTLPFVPQINNTAGFITDTLNWTLVTGTYTATGGESYLTIGNFRSNLSSDTLLINNTSPYWITYFYIDDVSLTPCTAIEEQNQNETIKIFPNPAKDFINISFTSKEEKNVSVEVYDLLGRKVFEKELPTPNSKLPAKIDMRSFPDGMYVVEINTGEGIYRKKVLKE